MEQKLIKSDIEMKIFTIRNLQVMLDSDLAKLYNVETKALNQAVKRNLERFPVSFRFQLSEHEMQILRSQFVTSNETHGGRRFLPFVFTEQGVAMLSAILKSPIAVTVSIEIIEAFVLMRYNQNQIVGLTQRLEGIESKQIQTENKLDKIFKALEREYIPKQGVFFEGQLFDAFVFVSSLVKRANKSLVLLDNYIDETTLLILSKRKPRVKCTVSTKINNSVKKDLEKHNSQYPEIILIDNHKIHDRFLIIDNTELYHIGASIKDLGNKCFAFSRMDELVEDVLSKL